MTDVTLLKHLDRAGAYYLPEAARDAVLAAAQQAGFRIFRIDVAHVANKQQLLKALAAGLHFPDWFGHNFDALADCLTDLEGEGIPGYLILLEHCTRLHVEAREHCATTLQIFAGAAEEWRDRGIPFWCLVDVEAPGLDTLPGTNGNDGEDIDA